MSEFTLIQPSRLNRLNLESVLAKVHQKVFVSGSGLVLSTALLIAHANINMVNLNFSCPMGLAPQQDRFEGRATSNNYFDNSLGSLLSTLNGNPKAKAGVEGSV